MKYIKLIVIFALITGGIVAALMLDSWINPKTSSGFMFPSEDRTDVDQLCEDIKNKWEKGVSWDTTIYLSCRAEIDQKKGMKLMSERSYMRARTVLRENAIDKLHDSFMNSLSDKEYSDAKVREYHKDVAFLALQERIPDLEKERSLKHIEDLFGLYEKIYAYINGSHKITPYFNPTPKNNNPYWRKFDSKKQDEVRKATDFKKNPLYHELSVVPGFETGLNESFVGRKCDESREQFYVGLCNQIKKHFDNYIVKNPEIGNESHIDLGSKWVDRTKLTDENKDKIGELYKKVYLEESNGNNKSTPGADILEAFKNRYLSDLKDMEKIIKQQMEANH